MTPRLRRPEDLSEDLQTLFAILREHVPTHSLQVSLSDAIAQLLECHRVV
jgi:hypothetical protein